MGSSNKSLESMDPSIFRLSRNIIMEKYEITKLAKDVEDGKTSRLDVIVFTSAGERINIEIQMNDQQNRPERVLYY